MATKRKFKSDAFEAIHSAVEDMYKAGTIDKATMKTFDDTCLSIPQELTPSEIKALRENNHVSQPVFARYLNTSESTVQVGNRRQAAKRPSIEATFNRPEARSRNAVLGYSREHQHSRSQSIHHAIILAHTENNLGTRLPLTS